MCIRDSPQPARILVGYLIVCAHITSVTFKRSVFKYLTAGLSGIGI